MSSAKANPLTIPPELDAEMTPAVRAFVQSLLARFAQFEAELQELRRRVEGKTPQNSSLPPSTQHPREATVAEAEIEEETWRPTGPREARSAADPHQRV